MKIARAASCVCVICMVLAAGIPWVWLNGPSPVVSIGLEKAIQSVRQLAETTEDHDSFISAFRSTLSDLRTLAGLHKVFKPAKETSPSRPPSLTDPACLLLTASISPLFTESFLPINPVKDKTSITHRPELPPPELHSRLHG